MLNTPLLIGSQIYLKKLQATDVTAQYVQWLNDPLINKFLESRYEIQSIESCQQFIDEANLQANNCFWGIYAEHSDQHIGNIKLGPIISDHRRASIGLIIGDKGYWGKGIASEAITLVTDYAFQHLALLKLDAGCYESNIGSKKAFIKSGYQIEAKLTAHYIYQEKTENALLLAKFSPQENKEAL